METPLLGGKEKAPCNVGGADKKMHAQALLAVQVFDDSMRPMDQRQLSHRDVDLETDYWRQPRGVERYVFCLQTHVTFPDDSSWGHKTV